MVNLNISFEELKIVGKQISAKATAFGDILEEIDGFNSQLQDAWKGSDIAKYTQAVEQQSVDMNKLKTTINDIGEFLVKVSNAYQAARDTNVNNIHLK